MTNCFLHVADVHLDSPLANLRQLDEATAERLQRASRRSFEIVVETAIQRQVGAVLIAGDLFDAPVRDASAGLWVESQFKRLVRADVPVVLIRGNHDAKSNARSISQWPNGVTEFDAGQASTHIIEQTGLAVHGQSFGARVETRDLAAQYPAPVSGFFNVGLLHTSLTGGGGHSQHGTYAPTSITTLEQLGYDYWALGHIHARSRQSHSSRCYVGYSGNTQGRHVNETGPKGCQLVEIVDGRPANIEFVSTDSLRWYVLDVDASELDHLRDIEDRLEPEAMQVLENSGGLPLAIRVRIVGETALHGQLTQAGVLEQLREALSTRLADWGDIWLESVRVESTPFLSSSTDELITPLKYLSQVAEDCRKDPILRKEMEDVLEELLKNARGDLSGYSWPLVQPSERDAEVTRLLGVAEDMLVARLMEGQNR